MIIVTSYKKENVHVHQSRNQQFSSRLFLHFSSTVNASTNQKGSSEGIVLIAREEKAEDILTSDLLKNAEEQKIIVVENTNSSQKKVSNNEQENGNHENNIEGRTAVKRDHSSRHANLNSEGLVTTNGINGSKRARLDDNNDNDIVDTTLDEPMVNGDIRNDPRNKLMDKLLGKDLHMPNGVCDINSTDLDLIAPAGERLSSSNSKTSSPDIFDSENNSDFGKYLEESETDTGLFSDVILGDLRIDSVDADPKSKNNDPNKTIPSLPDLGYHAVAQELRNPGTLPIRPNHDTSTLPNKGFSNNVHEKVPITSNTRSSQPRAPVPNDVVGGRYGNSSFQGRPTSMWNGSARPMLPPSYDSVTQNTDAPRPPAQQQLNAILEHRTKALVTPKMPSTEQQDNRQQATPQQQVNVTSTAPNSQPITSPVQPPTQQQQQQQPADTPVETMKPYRCRWDNCTRYEYI